MIQLRRQIGIAAVSAIVGLGFLSMTGCVTSSAYEEARQEANAAIVQYHAAQEKTLELETQNKRLRLQSEQLEASLRDTKERLVRTTQLWQDSRDELVTLKTERELHRKATSAPGAQPPSKPEGELPAEASEPKALPAQPATSEESRRRLLELMQEIKALLQQHR